MTHLYELYITDTERFDKSRVHQNMGITRLRSFSEWTAENKALGVGGAGKFGGF